MPDTIPRHVLCVPRISFPRKVRPPSIGVCHLFKTGSTALMIGATFPAAAGSRNHKAKVMSCNIPAIILHHCAIRPLRFQCAERFFDAWAGQIYGCTDIDQGSGADDSVCIRKGLIGRFGFCGKILARVGQLLFL
jgi:hypothetical protein